MDRDTDQLEVAGSSTERTRTRGAPRVAGALGPLPVTEPELATVPAARILVAENSDILSRAIEVGLLGLGQPSEILAAHTAEDIVQALDIADVAVLDASLTWLDVVDVCEQARRRESACFILVIALAASEYERVVVLDAGADDCLSVPAGLAELLARTRALLRRWHRSLRAEYVDPRSGVRLSAVAMQPERRAVSVSGWSVDLTSREYDVLDALLASAGRVVTRAELMESVWGRSESDGKAVDVTVGRIRRKLARAGAPSHISTVRGIGFRADRRVPIRATLL